MNQVEKKVDSSLYNYDSEEVKERIRQLMKEMGVKEYKEKTPSREGR